MTRGPPLGEWLLFALSLGFYSYTLAPSLAWADGARLQLDASLGGSNYLFLPELSRVELDGWPFARLGIAPWDHPQYVLLGSAILAIRIGDPLLRLNLLSAVPAAIAVALVFRLGKRMGCDAFPAAVGALSLCVSHTFWFHAVTAEVLALHSLYMICILSLGVEWLLQRRWALINLLMLVAGLGLANHMMLSLTLMPLAAWLIASRRPPAAPPARTAWSAWHQVVNRRTLLVPIALFLLGLAPWWIQFLRMTRAVGFGLTFRASTWFPGLPTMIFAQPPREFLTNFVLYCAHLLYQFTPVGVALGIWGAVHLLRDRLVGSLFVLTYLVHAAFSANYPVADRFAFHLPSYVIFSLFVSSGATNLMRLRWSPSWRRTVVGAALLAAVVVAPVVLYAAAPAMARSHGVSEATLGIPTIGAGARDGLAYFLNPNKRGDDTAWRFGVSTLAGLPRNAVVFTPKPDLEVYVVLRYLQAVGKLRSDVDVDPFAFVPMGRVPMEVLERSRALSPCRPVYLASLSEPSYPVGNLRSLFTIVREGNLYHLRSRTLTHGCALQAPKITFKEAIMGGLEGP